MQKNLKVSLSFSISGILILLLLSNILEPRLVQISKINEKMLEQKVKIEGSIINIQDKGSLQILSFKDSTKSINTLCKCGNLSSLEKNQKLIVIGKIQEYKNNLQIQAEKIIKK